MSVPRRRRRLPDEVRSATVRAVLCLAFTLVGVVVATLASYAGSWLMTPALMAMGLGVFGTMWCLLEILISRQVAAQRMRGSDSAHPMAGGRTAPEPLAARPLPRPGGAPHRPYQPGQPGQPGRPPYAPAGRPPGR
ncbi:MULTISPECIES: hypothetical protein [Kitasatospora]|uniref:DUF3040 domain-containing protein n=1 Tax=Kitasatospora cathayae TaxID=3004092 RepID=A0ABY7PZL0_9ACTN|nr:hypothetical protein [Kitasatospora sp. HUAS 3-15]WBP85689.1 hypothetical protein O1G21_07385 [Kitasatospora sp. HUAS 3-15]